MTRDVIIENVDTPIEEAVCNLADAKIGRLPVARNGKVISIITETDLFRIFLEMLGAREPGVWLAVLAPNVASELAQLTKSIIDTGVNVIALGTFLGESSENREVTILVTGINAQALEELVTPLTNRVVSKFL